MATLLLSLLLGYLLGAIPSAAIVARWQGRQIFEVGSGNMGAINTARHLGVGWGLLVLAVDIGKGALATYLAALLTADSPWSLAASYAAGVGAVAGHAWSVFVGFRGGKALATAFGVALILMPLGGLAALVLGTALLLLLRRSSLATVITALLYPLLIWAVSSTGATPETTLTAVLSTSLITAVVIIKQLPSLRRTAPHRL
ncbi:MAG: glycerol-3-phosphate acyltransferase [Truepera sp.]|nr:glycerol-3-phosphate acyltransferase [Truepera sp.]